MMDDAALDALVKDAEEVIMHLHFSPVGKYVAGDVQQRVGLALNAQREAIRALREQVRVSERLRATDAASAIDREQAEKARADALATEHTRLRAALTDPALLNIVKHVRSFYSTSNDTESDFCLFSRDDVERIHAALLAASQEEQ